MILLSAINTRSPPPLMLAGPPGSSVVSVPGVQPGSAVPESAFPSRLLMKHLHVFVDELLFCELPIYVQMLSISGASVLLQTLIIHLSSAFTNTYFSKFIIFILFVYGFLFHRTFTIPAESNRSAPLCYSFQGIRLEQAAFLTVHCPRVLTAYVGLATPLVSAFTYSIRLALTLTHCGHSSWVAVRRTSTA